MNYQFICDTFRKNRDYAGLCDALNRTVIGKRKPYSVSGLSDGAEPVFLKSLCEDFGNPYSPVILLFADEKKAVRYRDFFLTSGVPADYFPAREYGFNNITSSHEYENVRLKILASLVGLMEGASVICTTPEAVLQVTMPAKQLSELCIRISYDEPVEVEAVTALLTEAG